MHDQICQIVSFDKKIKMPKFGTKIAWFGYFCARILKKYCYILNQHHQICIIAKCYKRAKSPKFGFKDALYGYFSAKILKNSLS